LKRYSDKRKAREAEAKPFRDALIAKVRCCERCGLAGQGYGHPNVRLCVHEIANGPLRQKALDQPYAVLVLCWPCNELATDKGTWPEAEQLACLKINRPEDYDLVAYNRLVNERAPNRITEEEVDHYI
jgi:hypothetical protein